MSGNMNLFASLDNYVKAKVKLRNKNVVNVVGEFGVLIRQGKK